MHTFEAYLAFPQIDGEVDELAVLLHQVPDTMWLQILMRLFLQVKTDGCSTAERVAARVLHDGERRSVRLPDVLLVIVVF